MASTSTRPTTIHAGHRARIKERLNNLGKTDLREHELLEMLLFYSIPRVNTNELAHTLLDEFGSIENIINTDPSILMQVSGVGPATASLFSLLCEIRKRTNIENHNTKRFNASTLSAVGNFLVDYYKGNSREEICALLLDGSFRMIEFKRIASGSVNTSCMDIKCFVRHAVVMEATHVILSHNHPNGDTAPSAQDRQLSMMLEAALHPLDIELVEHIIVSGMCYSPTMHLRATAPNRAAMLEKYKSFYNN